MHQVYKVSDRTIQVDWSGGRSFAAPSAVQLASLSKALAVQLYKLGWPRFQLVQADHALSLVFEKPPAGDFSLQGMVADLNTLVGKLGKPSRKLDRKPNHHVLAVQYGGTAGQDLDWLAAETGMGTQALIDLHSSAIYTVEFLGFLPGFAYLSGLPEVLQLPRRSSPRARVPAGTLAVGAHYCAIYPWESPGGWHLLGRVEQVLFDPEAATAEGRCFFHSGDTVQFIRVDHA